MTYENPFTPSFGEIPAHLAGRKELIGSMERAYASTLRRPELTTILYGARGTGKTTLLSVLAHRAEQAGWVAVSVTSMPGMLEDIEIGVRRRAQHLVDEHATPHLTGVSVAGLGGVSFESAQQPLSNWRSRMTDLVEELNESQAGLLITVDEVDSDLDEMVELAAVYQHFVREDRKVALLMAGLPHNISSLMTNKTVSFLRRAQACRLGAIADYDVEAALLKTIRENGRSASTEGVAHAVRAIGGFPFLLQLIGYRAWDASPDAPEISLADFELGIDQARRETEDRILEATYRELSAGDLRFLEAMLLDEDETKVADLVKRLGRSSAQVSQYRRRLIDAGVIGSRRRGVVAFELPFFREFLQERV